MPSIVKWEKDFGEREDGKRELARKFDHPFEDLEEESPGTTTHASKTPEYLHVLSPAQVPPASQAQ